MERVPIFKTKNLRLASFNYDIRITSLYIADIEITSLQYKFYVGNKNKIFLTIIHVCILRLVNFLFTLIISDCLRLFPPSIFQIKKKKNNKNIQIYFQLVNVGIFLLITCGVIFSQRMLRLCHSKIFLATKREKIFCNIIYPVWYCLYNLWNI